MAQPREAPLTPRDTMKRKRSRRAFAFAVAVAFAFRAGRPLTQGRPEPRRQPPGCRPRKPKATVGGRSGERGRAGRAGAEQIHREAEARRSAAEESERRAARPPLWQRSKARRGIARRTPDGTSSPYPPRFPDSRIRRRGPAPSIHAQGPQPAAWRSGARTAGRALAGDAKSAKRGRPWPAAHRV